MSTAERVGLAFIGLAMVTTLILPGRQTAQVINAFGSVFNSSLKTAMGR